MHLPAGTHDGTVSADVPSSPLIVSRYPPFCGCQHINRVKDMLRLIFCDGADADIKESESLAQELGTGAPQATP